MGSSRLVALAFAALAVLLSADARADDLAVRGRISDPTGRALPGVVVTLTPAPPAPPVTAITDEGGAYSIAVASGRYDLKAELGGFETAERRGVTVDRAAVVVDLALALAPFRDAVTVIAEAPQSLLSEPEPNAPAIVSRQVIDTAMLPNSRYDDVLTLMPGVVRGPDDQISVGGARSTEGALFVDGVNLTDPTTGEPGLVVPIEAVDSVEVHSGGYPADLGPATAGVTSLNTRSGADQFHVSLDSLFPRLLVQGGAVQGVAYWEPNVGASGPLVKGRVYYEQGVSYRFDRNEFTTLSGQQHNIFNAPQSWSQIDAQISSQNRLRFALAVDQQDTNHAHITAFTPQASVPALNQHAWSVLASDRWTMSPRASLELRASTIRIDTTLVPDGSAPFVIGHEGSEGAYFDTRNRDADRVEAGGSLLWSASEKQVLKFGASAGTASLDDAEESAPVTYVRQDGSVSRVVRFAQLPQFHVSSVEADLFAQDTWTPRSWLTLDAGIRYDHSSGLSEGVLSPRIAWTAKHDRSRTSVSGSGGLFADKVVLSALAFPHSTSRTVSVFDATGTLDGAPITYSNAVGGDLRMPRAARWDLGLDQQFAGAWVAHVHYQERRGRDEFVIAPGTTASSTGSLFLTSDGRSTGRSLETTVGHGPSGGAGEVYFSYVRSSAVGNLNSLDAIAGTFAEPLVQPDAVGPLATSVPNRMLAWGLFHLPSHLTVAPFVDVRSGFAYSAVDDNWLYTGPRNGLRFPWFGSLDLSITRIVDLPGRLPSARVGLKLYNIASVHSEREIQRSVAAPDFGTLYDPTPRDFSFVCVFLLGHR